MKKKKRHAASDENCGGGWTKNLGFRKALFVQSDYHYSGEISENSDTNVDGHRITNEARYEKPEMRVFISP